MYVSGVMPAICKGRDSERDLQCHMASDDNLNVAKESQAGHDIEEGQW